ncbi:hypothetical protein T265_10926 [Opisthorchis viverrini]|uniref:Uncharacterized protein n=1 Tax=Opisthorchis viverrini TaxID=6198 RepID=A0A074ZBE1_OPIVI|nr:hypothetical protein T265_10926 [Opisthorchis viverrini]KER20540.1 hypothetical protein T265_10926 [Opisthorchis viverrini]
MPTPRQEDDLGPQPKPLARKPDLAVRSTAHSALIRLDIVEACRNIGGWDSLLVAEQVAVDYFTEVGHSLLDVSSPNEETLSVHGWPVTSCSTACIYITFEEFGQPGSIQALVPPSCGMATRHRSATAERLPVAVSLVREISAEHMQTTTDSLYSLVRVALHQHCFGCFLQPHLHSKPSCRHCLSGDSFSPAENKSTVAVNTSQTRDSAGFQFRGV